MSELALQNVEQWILTHARQAKVAAIFDLDSTLFCVSPRTQAILRQLAQEPDFFARFPEAAQILKEVVVEPTDWGVKQVLERHQIVGELDLFLAVRDYWRTHFFGNHYLDRDHVYPGAVEYVRALEAAGAHILYLTGRNDTLMREGTERILRHWDFPLANSGDLYMKPSEVETDEGFKADQLTELLKTYNKICFFENEPVILEQVVQRLPEIKVIFVDSIHSGRGVAPAGLMTIGMDYRFKRP